MGVTEEVQGGEEIPNPAAEQKKADVFARVVALVTLALTCFNTYTTFSNKARDDKRHNQTLLNSAWDELAGAEAAPAIKSSAALTAKQRQDLDKVGRKIDEALSYDPKSPLALTLKGIYFAKCRMPAEARKKFQQALVIDPKFARAESAIGRLLADEGKCEEAIVAFQETTNMDPKLPSPYLGWAFCLRRLKRFDEAVVVLQKGIESAPTFAPLYVDLGNIYVEQGRGEDALNQYKNCRDVDDSVSACYKNAVVVLLRLKREAEAYELANQAEAKGTVVRIERKPKQEAGVHSS
jgi:tetratricopeptide (TPR) repeat protein